MYPASQGFFEAMSAPGRNIKVKASFNGGVTLYGDGTDGSVVSISLIEQMDTEGLSIGTTGMAQLEISIRQPSTPIPLVSGIVVPYIGTEVNGVDEWVRLGLYYIVDTPTRDGDVFKITAFDGFCRMERDYIPSITFPASAEDIVDDICNQCGISWNGTLPIKTIGTPLEGTMREWVGWIAGCNGKSARFDRYGDLFFGWYNDNPYALSISEDVQFMSGVELLQDSNFSVNSITTGTEENPLSAGSGVGIVFTNPLVDQADVDAIFAGVEGYNYRPMKVKWRGNPCLEAGDTVWVERNGSGYPCLVMAHTLTVNGGMSDDITCFGQSEEGYALNNSPTAQAIHAAFTTLENALAEASALINGAKGGVFEVTDSDGDGINDGWLIKQSPVAGFLGNVIKANHQGIGFSSDGGATFNVAITTDGSISADFINTGRLNAGLIYVGDEQLENYVYIGYRKPGDNTTPMCIRIGIGVMSATEGMILELIGNRISFYNASDVNDYINGVTTADQYTATALAYWDDDEFVLNQLKQMRLGTTIIQARANGSISFIGA